MSAYQSHVNLLHVPNSRPFFWLSFFLSSCDGQPFLSVAISLSLFSFLFPLFHIHTHSLTQPSSSSSPFLRPPPIYYSPILPCSKHPDPAGLTTFGLLTPITSISTLLYISSQTKEKTHHDRNKPNTSTLNGKYHQTLLLLLFFKTRQVVTPRP